MKNNLLLLALAAFTLNAHAQLNKKWSVTQSLSGGVYPSSPVNSLMENNVYFITASNEFFEPTEDSVKGVIRKIDSAGTLLWTTVIQQVASLLDFPVLDANLAGIPDSKTGNGFMMPVEDVFSVYNVNSTTSRLVRLDKTTGAILWNVQLTNINRVSSFILDTLGNIYLTGRTPETDSAGYKSNGIAVAKYDLNGVRLWKKTKYTTGYRTAPVDLAIDNGGNIIVCGKKAPKLNQGTDYDKIFVTKYSNAGTPLWTKEFTETTTASGNMAMAADSNNDLRVVEDTSTGILKESGGESKDNTAVAVPLPAGTTNKNSSITTTVKVRKLAGANGAVQWTKTINNSELRGIRMVSTPLVYGTTYVAASTGIYTYDAAGNLLWSNNLSNIIGGWNGSMGAVCFVATNVSATEPLDNFLVQLDAATGAVLFQKNLSFGNHEEYQGDYIGVIALDTWEHAYLLINDNVPPYGTRLTKLSPCSEFTYNFNATAAAVNVNNATCNNGQISVNWSGTFNSWAHVELWKGSTKVSFNDPHPPPYVFQNLSAATYTIKVFDESCGEQDTTVTIKCPAPSAGLATINIMSTSAKAKWNSPSCSNGFRLQYRQTGTTTWTTVSGIATEFYTITGLTSGLSFQWRVATKCNSSGTAVYSAYSIIKTFTTQSPRIADEYTAANDYSIEIYPNPVSERMMITTENEISSAIIKIFNAQGQLILEKNIKALNENESAEIETGSLTKGIYLLQIISEEGRVSKRFVKE